MDNKDNEDLLKEDLIKTDIVWIPLLPSKSEILDARDQISIQLDEITAINAIYGPITIHNFGIDFISLQSKLLSDQIKFSSNLETSFTERDELDVRIFFIPVIEGFDEKIEKSKYFVDVNYENSDFTIYSLVLSRNVSETLPFKNRRYWRITYLYARLTVFYNCEYPLNNPGLLFEFSLELPERISLKLCEEIKQILIDRTADQECIFQAVNCLESILDDLCDHLQISEDLWEQMRRLNNQREFERHFDNSLTVENDQLDPFEQINEYKDIDFITDQDAVSKINVNSELSNVMNSKEQLNVTIASNFSRFSIKDQRKLYSRGIFDMGPGFLDDTILEYSSRDIEMNDYKIGTENFNDSKFLINADFSNNSSHYLKEEDKLLLSSKRFNQDFRILQIIFSNNDSIITNSLHLIDQNCYQVSVYKISTKKFDKLFEQIFSKVSSLIMLQHRYIVRYYQCWVEDNDLKNDYVLFYIQTEFMNDNLTLFDYLQKGKITNREIHIIWSLFRQILEILSYCHQNGICHIALSSKCIYIEEDIYGYSIKLSNFIFGTYLDHLNKEKSSDIEFSNTFSENNQLNNMIKYDIYCTGMIFCEMWLKIKYGNEYFSLLNKFLSWLENTNITEELNFGEINQISYNTKNIEDMFNFTIQIPNEFKYIPKSALLIMRKLIYENNKINSVDELLKCELLPNSIEKNEFQYYLSRICNSKTHESHITLNTLFNRSIDEISSAAFLFDIQKDEKINMIDLTFSDIVKTSITEILHNHDFTPWKLPILYPVQFLPKNNNNSNFDKMLYESKLRMGKPHLLLDISNNLLFLPNSAPFCMMYSLLSLFCDPELNQNKYSDTFDESNINYNNMEKNFDSTNYIRSNNKDYSNNNINNNTNNINITSNKDNYLNLNFQFEQPIQRYSLFSIYEQPVNIREHVIGPPKSSLSLVFDIVYQLNDNEFNNEYSKNTLEKSTEFNSKLFDDLLIQLEGLLLSLKLVIPWLDYLEDEPIVRITFPPLVTLIFDEIFNYIVGKQDYDENIKLSSDNLYLKKDDIQDNYLKDLLFQKYEFEWIFDNKSRSYRLKSMYENDFIKKAQNYLIYINNDQISLYIQLMNEMLDILSESTELLIYKDKKVKIYFDPLMEYDVNTYDFNTILYCINSLNHGNKYIYSMGGSYSQKINSTLAFFNNKNSLNEDKTFNINTTNSINCILGEIAIELIINQVCEKAKKYRTEFVNTGGYINGVSIFEIQNSNNNSNHEISELSKNLILKPISLLKSCYPRVIVMTQKNKLQPKVLSLTRKLWQIGVRSEYRLTPVQSLSIFLEKLKRDTLIELLIIVMNLNKTSNINNIEDEKETQIDKNNSIDNANLNANLSFIDKDNRDCIDNNDEQNNSSIHTETCRNKYVSYRIEAIAGLYYENNTNHNTKIIMENEETVINYVINKRKRQVID